MANTPPARRRLHPRRRLPWPAVLALSVVGHVVGVGLFFLFAAAWSGKAPKRVARPISLRALDARQWAHNRGTPLVRGGPATAAHRSPKPERMPSGQVVDVAPGNQQESPDAKYLAETSNRVQRETRAEHPTPTRAQAGALNQTPAAQQSHQGRATAEAMALNHLVPRWDPLVHAEDGPRPSSSDRTQRASSATAPIAAGPSQSGTTYRNDGHGEGGASSPDDLSGVEVGNGTFLNTREWKFAAFFNRVKQAVASHWDPQGRLRAQDPQGHRVGSVNRITEVSVTLDSEGRLRNLVVVKSSGLDFLDAEAVHAFERAAPFLNPPEALLRDGVINFGFGFHLFNDGAQMPQMFRPPRSGPGF